MVLAIPAYDSMSQVVPFTARDNATYLQKVNGIREKLNELIEWSGLTNEQLVAKINDDFDLLELQWNEELTTTREEHTAHVNTLRTEIINQLSTPGTPAYDLIVDAAGEVYDPATRDLVTGASLTRTALDARFPLKATRDTDTADLVKVSPLTRAAVITAARVGGQMINGSRWLIVGDSLSIQGTTAANGTNHTDSLAWRTKGRMKEVRRAAVSGANSTQQLVSVRQAITDGVAPTMATVMVGTNDLGQSVDIETWKTNMRAIVQELRAIGCESVIYTLPPRSPNPGGNERAPSLVNGTWNAWLRAYAREQGFPLVDVWRIVADPATGEHKAGWYDTADGVHLTPVAHRAIADEALRVLSPILTPMSLPVSRALFDGNKIVDGVFTSAAIPATWVRSAPLTWNAVADATAPGGFAVEHDSTDPVTRPDFKQLVTGLTIGQKYAFSGLFKIITNVDVPSGVGMRFTIIETTGVTYSLWCFGQNMPTAEWMETYFEYTATKTEATFTWQYLKPAGVATNRIVSRLGAVGLYPVVASV